MSCCYCLYSSLHTACISTAAAATTILHHQAVYNDLREKIDAEFDAQGGLRDAQSAVDAALADADQLRSALSTVIPAAQSQRDALIAHSVEAAAAAAKTDGQTEDPEALVSALT
jgi:hypothetical protein